MRGETMIPEQEIIALVEKLHQSSCRAGIVATGGAVQAISWLLTVPGGSRWINEAVVPYSAHALEAYLGRVPEHYCDETTAEHMARRARDRAAWIELDHDLVLGIGATASLATDRPKRGEHRCHAATWDGTTLRVHSLFLEKGKRSRLEEDALCSRMLLNLIAESVGLPDRVPLGLGPGDRFTERHETAPGALWRLLHGVTRRITQVPGGLLQEGAPVPGAVLPGSFNPLHEGHLALAKVASDVLGTRVHFELSVTNVDKPRLNVAEILKRARQFEWSNYLELTDAPLFVQKAEIFPGCTFVVGADTAERILAPRYYAEGELGMLHALQQIATRRCRFLVAARRREDGTICTVKDLRIPELYRPLFQEIPMEQFLFDISSTAIRQAGKARV